MVDGWPDKAESIAAEGLARLRRFERPTPAFGGQYSIQLSYRRFLPHCAAESSRHFNAPEPNDDYLRRTVLYPTELQARGSNNFTVCAGWRPIYRRRGVRFKLMWSSGISKAIRPVSVPAVIGAV